MSVVPLDPRWVRGSHGRLPEDPEDGPLLLTSDAGLGRETVAATDVHDLVLGAAGVRVAETVAATVPGAVPAAVPAT
jgi:hypothetical protein